MPRLPFRLGRRGPPAPRDTASGLLLSGGAATFSQLWRVGVTLLVHAALRHLLGPDPWGLWHWSEPLFLLFGQLRDLGIPGHLVRIRDRPYGNFLLLQLGWGAALGLLVVAAAPLLGRAYSEPDPELVPVVRLLALFLFFEGLAKVPLTFFEAELEIGQAVVPEVLRNATFAVVSLALAIDERGVWSLIVAHVVAVAVYTAALWSRAWGRMPLALHRGVLQPLLRRSLPLAVMSLLVLLQGKVDGFVLGFRFPGEVIGEYGMALQLGFFLSSLVALPVSRALYPALVQLQGEPRRFFEAYRLATVLLLCLEVPYALALYVNADLVCLLYGGSAWQQAPGFLRILCFAPLIQPFSRCAGDVLLTHHRDRVLILSSTMTLLALIAGGLLLTLWLGPAGLAWANLFPLGAAVVAWAVHRIAPADFRGLVRDLGFVYWVPLPLFFLAWLVPAGAPWLRLAASAVAAGAALAVYVRRFGTDFRRFFRPIPELGRTNPP